MFTIPYEYVNILIVRSFATFFLMETDMNSQTNMLSGRKAPEEGKRAISQPCDVTPLTSALDSQCT